MVHRVRVEPLGADVLVADGDTLLPAAEHQGLAWPSVCGGKASCSSCIVRVLDGQAALGPVTEGEYECLLHYRGLKAAEVRNTRLACQLQVHGDATVRKVGVRWKDRRRWAPGTP
jgi:ferredoxin